MRQRKFESDAVPLLRQGQVPLRRLFTLDYAAFMASCPRLRPTTALQAGRSTCGHDSAAAILDFRPRLANRCSTTCHFGDFRAAIPVFKPRIGNHCSTTYHFGDFPASILDFRPRIGNHCSKEGINGQTPAAHLQHAFHHALTMRLAIASLYRRRFDSGGKSGC